jgi:hypothetical protein
MPNMPAAGQAPFGAPGFANMNMGGMAGFAGYGSPGGAMQNQQPYMQEQANSRRGRVGHSPPPGGRQRRQ